MRKGFTLLEMINAVAIFALVIAGVGSAFIGVLRMSRTAMTEAELAVRMRTFREKLLFHLEPVHDNRVWAGLLTAGSGIEAGVRVQSTGEGYDLATGNTVPQTIKLVADGSGLYLNEGDGTRVEKNRRWLNPSGIPLKQGADGLDASVQQDALLYTVGFEASSGGVTRKERVVVPIFGRRQVKNTGSVFHD